MRTWNAVKPESNSGTFTINSDLRHSRITTQYFDGLGRPLQTVIKHGSLTTGVGNEPVDMISANVYDEFGREVYKYLPFATTATDATKDNGLFKLNPFQQQVAFYNTQLSGQAGETNLGPNNLNWAYSKINYEASPLNRVNDTYAPGASWVGSEEASITHPVKAKYWVNTVNDAVRTWDVTDITNDFGTYSTTTSYPVGALYKNGTEDEHGKQVIEFKDKEGKVILKKVQLTASADNGSGSDYDGWLCTYYIYDDLGNLRCVIQPEGVKALSTSNWQLTTVLLTERCFRYEYDQHNRMIMKKVPGADPVYMVYDARDRLVMTQDANLRAANKWLITKYDGLNRPIETGLWNNDGSTLVNHQDYASGSTSYPSTALGYELLTIAHYDDYTGLPAGLSSSYLNSWNGHFSATDNNLYPYPQMPAQSTALKGMATWTQTKILGSSPAQFISTVSIYDDKGRVIQ
ncbi:MAG TPA: DUF6443 domain-containing protein, partial [Chitinophagaceae bacterium]